MSSPFLLHLMFPINRKCNRILNTYVLLCSYCTPYEFNFQLYITDSSFMFLPTSLIYFLQSPVVVIPVQENHYLHKCPSIDCLPSIQVIQVLPFVLCYVQFLCVPWDRKVSVVKLSIFSSWLINIQLILFEVSPIF